MDDDSYQIIVIIRFSLYTSRGFYKKMPLDELYSNERMNRRFEMFEKVCLPSLRNQSTRIYIVLLVSKKMPDEYLQRIRRYEDVHISLIGENDDFSNNSIALKGVLKPNVKWISTVKLDDDDALHPSFSRKIMEYVGTCKPGTYSLVSFPNGCQFVYGTDRCSECSTKLVACGLTLIAPSRSKHNVYHEPYASGSAKFSRSLRFRVTFDDTELMYLVSDHDYNHSCRGVWDKKTKANDELLERIKANFLFIK